ncbi:MAG: acetyl-CoA carboxylase, carboxyltransferase component, partial [Microbacterium sp.]|nr:acetyl-CoA carboxylase, carboxyltransferase component [Microbacterium sp.]
TASSWVGLSLGGAPPAPAVDRMRGMAKPLDVAPLLQLRDGYGDREETEAVRLFAEANGAQFWPLVLDQPLPGVVFRDAAGRPRQMQGAGRIVRFPGDPEIEIANSAFQYAI